MAMELTENEIRAAAAEVGSAFAAYDAAPSPEHVFSLRHESAMREFFGTAEKVQRARRRRRVLRNLAACLAGLIVAMAGAYTFIPEARAAVRSIVQTFGAPEQLRYSSVQEAVDMYVGYLKSSSLQDLAVSGNYIYTAEPGLDPEKTDRKGKKTAEYYALSAQHQAEFIKLQFGEDAWDDVTFYKTEYPYIVSINGYCMADTGKAISKTMYDELLDAYWKQVAEKENVKAEDLFRDGYYSDLAMKYLDSVPVKKIEDCDTQAYEICLLFHGKEQGKYKGSFRFLVSGRDDVWEIKSGLYWDTGWYWY